MADHSISISISAAASAGDTLLIAESATNYGTAILDKQLKIVGPGYFLAENNVPGVTPGVDDQPATMTLSFSNSTIKGSRFVGLTITSVAYAVLDTDILWDRCRFSGNIAWSGKTDFRATRCDFGGFLVIAGTLAASKCINCSAIGCSMNHIRLYHGAVASHCTIRDINGGSWLLIDSESALTNSVIIAWNHTSAPQITGSVTLCVGVNVDLPPTGTGAPDINNNYDLIATGDRSTVILDTASGVNTNFDLHWSLNTSDGANPSLGNASDGTNIGFTGRPVTYRLAGQPSIPKISNLVVPGLASPTSGLNVKVTVSEPAP